MLSVRAAVLGIFVFLLAPVCLSGGFCGPSPGAAGGWKVFSSRAGWSLHYPPDWRIGSCHNCPDPTAPNVFVDFFPPGETNSDGWVMVDRLADRPSGMSVKGWFTRLKQTANLNPRLKEQRINLNGLPALKVRYRNPHAGGQETESVYVVAGSRTFQINFGGDLPGRPLEDLGNYRIYRRMLGTFTVKR